MPVIHGDPDFGAVECGRVVHPVTGHGHDRPIPLQRSHDPQLVLGIDAGEDGDLPDRLREGVLRHGLDLRSRDRAAVGGDAQKGGDHAGRPGVIAGDHERANSRSLRPRHRVPRLVARRVDHPDDPGQHEVLLDASSRSSRSKSRWAPIDRRWRACAAPGRPNPFTSGSPRGAPRPGRPVSPKLLRAAREEHAGRAQKMRRALPLVVGPCLASLRADEKGLPGGGAGQRFRAQSDLACGDDERLRSGRPVPSSARLRGSRCAVGDGERAFQLDTQRPSTAPLPSRVTRPPSVFAAPRDTRPLPPPPRHGHFVAGECRLASGDDVRRA